MREGLLALAVGTGLQVMAAIMEADVTAVCGPQGRHDPERTAVRHGHGGGSVSLGGRRIPVERPRMRAIDGSGELPVASYELFSDTEIGALACECRETVSPCLTSVSAGLTFSIPVPGQPGMIARCGLATRLSDARPRAELAGSV